MDRQYLAGLAGSVLLLLLGPNVQGLPVQHSGLIRPPAIVIYGLNERICIKSTSDTIHVTKSTLVIWCSKYAYKKTCTLQHLEEDFARFLTGSQLVCVPFTFSKWQSHFRTCIFWHHQQVAADVEGGRTACALLELSLLQLAADLRRQPPGQPHHQTTWSHSLPCPHYHSLRGHSLPLHWSLHDGLRGLHADIHGGLYIGLHGQRQGWGPQGCCCCSCYSRRSRSKWGPANPEEKEQLIKLIYFKKAILEDFFNIVYRPTQIWYYLKHHMI